eukprot:gene6994-11160_t
MNSKHEPNKKEEDDFLFEGRFNLIDDCSEKISMNLIRQTFTLQSSLLRNLLLSGTTEMELSLTYFKYLYHFNRIINYLKEKEFEQIPKKFLTDFLIIPNYFFENVLFKKIDSEENLNIIDELILRDFHFNSNFENNEASKERILILKKSKEFKRILKLEKYYTKLMYHFNEAWKKNLMRFILKKLKQIKREIYKELIIKTIRKMESESESKKLLFDLNSFVTFIESKIWNLKKFVELNWKMIENEKLKLKVEQFQELNGKIKKTIFEFKNILSLISVDIHNSTNFLKKTTILRTVQIRKEEEFLIFLWLFDPNLNEYLSKIEQKQIIKILTAQKTSKIDKMKNISIEDILLQKLSQNENLDIYEEIQKLFKLFKPKNIIFPIEKTYYKNGIFETLETIFSIKKLIKIFKNFLFGSNKEIKKLNLLIEENLNFFHSDVFSFQYFEKKFIENFEIFTMENTNILLKDSYEIKLKRDIIHKNMPFLIGRKKSKISIDLLMKFPTSEKVLSKLENKNQIFWEESVFEFLIFGFFQSFNHLSKENYQILKENIEETNFKQKILERMIKEEIKFNGEYMKYFNEFEKFDEEKLDWLSDTFLKWNLIQRKLNPKKNKEIEEIDWIHSLTLSKQFKVSKLLLMILFNRESLEKEIVYFLFKILRFFKDQDIYCLFYLRTILSEINIQFQIDYLISFMKYCGFLEDLYLFDDTKFELENSKPKEWEELKPLFLKMMEKPNEKMISTFENIKFQMERI